MDIGKPTRIWIFRDNEGRLRVTPPLVVLTPNQALQLRNYATGSALAVFPQGILAGSATVEVKDHQPVSVTVAASAPQFFEYDVTIGEEKAIGGSKPGGIIDP